MRNKYHLKEDKKIYLKPKRWKEFFSLLSEKQQPYFKIVIATGGRINEVCNVCWKDIDEEEKSLKFRITKVKAVKGEKRPEPRTIIVSTELIDWLKRYKNTFKLRIDEPFVQMTKVGIDKIIKTKLKEIGMLNWKDFSSHNLRKTHGNWLKACGVDGSEIASRLGHDMNTMLKHYVSSNLFNAEDITLIKDILTDELINRLNPPKQ
jgi:integrase